MKKRYIRILVSIFTAAILVMQFAGCGKSVSPGATWEVSETTHLSKLTISEGAVVKAPDGKSLTMTVDGVETPVAPGTYTGDIVLKCLSN